VSSKNWVDFILRRKREEKPKFNYSTGDSHLLAVALRKKVDSLAGFARKYLFDPLQIKNATWDHDPQGNEFGGNNLQLSFAAVRRWGAALLESGAYKGKEVIPSTWVREMWKHQSEAPAEFVEFAVTGYGYYWWKVRVNEIDGNCALGYGGQFLCLFPAVNAQFTIFSRTPRAAKLREHYREIQALLKQLVKRKATTKAWPPADAKP
jgi:CubicO group peptidase (beta-lactamase class C family)